MMRVAFVHDWLTGMRGGERVLEEMLRVYPQAEVFTLLHTPGSVSRAIEDRPIHTSWIDRIPGAAQHYRYWLPFFPAAIERFDLGGFDLVISSSHCVAKGVRVPPGVPHVCYCHTPMRYLYDQASAYADRFSWPVRLGFNMFRRRLRAWDRATAHRVTHFIANSAHVNERIVRAYGRDATVIHPPVDIERFTPAPVREDFYVTIAALVPYKRVDLVIDAFNALGRRLIVVGSGPEERALRARAGSTISFTGWIADAEVAELLGRCRGLVFAGVEDFGIALVEAQAAGAPVIAYAAGGALESVIDSALPGATGVLFRQQSVAAIVDAVHAADTRQFEGEALVRNAVRFSSERFRSELRAEIEAVLAAPQAAPAMVMV